MFDMTFPTPKSLNKYGDDDDSVNRKNFTRGGS